MTNFRYFRTFIDEDSQVEKVMMSRSRSCPAFGTKQDTEEQEQEQLAKGQLASLSVRSEAEMQALVQEMRARPAKESADPPSGETEHTIEPEPTATAMLPGALSKGSRGHPLLCKRPCVRMAKGTCKMGNACEYCHHDAHGPTASLSKGQRRRFKRMDTGELLATLLPHIQKAVADAGISVELVEIVERKAAAQTPRDDDLDGILGHMSLSNLLSFIIARDEGFRIPLREKVEGILAFDDTKLIHV